MWRVVPALGFEHVQQGAFSWIDPEVLVAK